MADKCEMCGYPLKHLTGGYCPECGHTFDRNREFLKRDRRNSILLRCNIAMLCLAGLMLLTGIFRSIDGDFPYWRWDHDRDNPSMIGLLGVLWFSSAVLINRSSKTRPSRPELTIYLFFIFLYVMAAIWAVVQYI